MKLNFETLEQRSLLDGSVLPVLIANDPTGIISAIVTNPPPLLILPDPSDPVDIPPPGQPFGYKVVPIIPDPTDPVDIPAPK